MCTALNLKTKDYYFGRNLDLDVSYGEEVCVAPRRFPFLFKEERDMLEHYALIGMATVVNETPLFYEAANEHGLAMAGLNFPENACYFPVSEDKDNIAPFELIPWILGQCANMDEALVLLGRINVADINFSQKLPNSPLHWMLTYKDKSVVIEQMKNGIQIYENPTGVLTNNPPFEYHLFNLNNYRNLGITNGENKLSADIKLNEYCQGLGAMGLPGDVSSMSRFVRMVFGREHSVCDGDEAASVGQFFHLLSSVEMVKGICLVPSGRFDITNYSACINLNRGLYYYTTYDNRQITCIDMHRADLNADELFRFPLVKEQQIAYIN